MRLVVLPNLELYLRLLDPELSPETQQNEMKRYEAWRVYGALQVSTRSYLIFCDGLPDGCVRIPFDS